LPSDLLRVPSFRQQAPEKAHIPLTLLTLSLAHLRATVLKRQLNQ
jgi:hypothetical protein